MFYEDQTLLGAYTRGRGGGYLGADLFPQKVKTMTATGAEPLFFLPKSLFNVKKYIAYCHSFHYSGQASLLKS